MQWKLHILRNVRELVVFDLSTVWLGNLCDNNSVTDVTEQIRGSWRRNEELYQLFEFQSRPASAANLRRCFCFQWNEHKQFLCRAGRNLPHQSHLWKIKYDTEKRRLMSSIRVEKTSNTCGYVSFWKLCRYKTGRETKTLFAVEKNELQLLLISSLISLKTWILFIVEKKPLTKTNSAVQMMNTRGQH